MGPLNFNTLDVQNHPYIRLTYNTSGSYDSYENSTGIHGYGNTASHRLITTQSADPCRCFQVGSSYPHDSILPPSWSGVIGETLDSVIMLGCQQNSGDCHINTQIEYWFYPQEDNSTLLVYFSFAEEDVTHHNATENPRFYIEVLDGQTGQLIQSGHYPNESGNGYNNNWPYSRFLAVPSGNQSSQDHHTAPNQYGISTYYWANPQATPTTFDFRECPDSQNGSGTSYTVKWFEYKPLAFNLKSYAEQHKSVKLRIRCRSCQYFAHWSYGLFAAKMIPGVMQVDACGDQPVHLSVPWGFLEQTYEWHYGYDSVDAINKVWDLYDPPAGIISEGQYAVYVTNQDLLYPYYRCEMKSYTGVPFIYEAHIKNYYIKPNFTFEQLFNNCDLTVKLIDSSDVFVKVPASQPGAPPDTTYQEIQNIKWYVKQLTTNHFIYIGDSPEGYTYTFDSTMITPDGQATIKIVVQDEELKCIDSIEKVIQLDMSAIEKVYSQDTIRTCEEKLPVVYDQAYFGDTQSWSTEGTRRVNYEGLAWNGCDSLVDVTLLVRKPRVDIVFDLDFCDEFSTTLAAVTDEEVAEYKWNTGEITPNITITTPGTYSLEIVSEDGCTSSNTITIPACKPFLNLANTITPSNMDGVNDYFSIPQRSLIQSLEFTVFNRNGEMVYHTTNKDFEWNGSENGKLFVGATYNYILRITDYEGVSSTHKGSITIL